MGESSWRLFVAATLFGVVTAVYRTFAGDLLQRYGGMNKTLSRYFRGLIGAAGLLGGVAGDFVQHFGLRRTFRIAIFAITLAIGVVAIRPDLTSIACCSGVVFGATFILITGLSGIWSINIFQERPSAGFGATFF